MELNDELARELLLALEATEPTVATAVGGQGRKASLFSSTNLSRNLDGFYQWGDSQQRETTQLDFLQSRQEGSAMTAVEGQTETVVGGDGTVYHMANNTYVTQSSSQMTQVEAGVQNLSQAVQRDARRYAP